MRMMMQFTVPVEAGNETIRNGTLGPMLEKILTAMKPEAAYFTTMESGERGGFIVFDMQDPSELPGFAEPLFLSYNARVKCFPVMTAQDLAKAGPAIAKAVADFK